VTAVLAGYCEPDEHGKRPPQALYGTVKMLATSIPKGIEVARSARPRSTPRSWNGRPVNTERRLRTRRARLTERLAVGCFPSGAFGLLAIPIGCFPELRRYQGSACGAWEGFLRANPVS
jgi:hypothetical protein